LKIIWRAVLVSGGARGQGAAEARLLVAQGAKVVIGDVLDNQGQSLAVELGPAASFVRHDVTSEAKVSANRTINYNRAWLAASAGRAACLTNTILS
jgi:NAD(P)-dependent dehydrogenase (short-subunit alcohol dehydrogenase family)